MVSLPHLWSLLTGKYDFDLIWSALVWPSEILDISLLYNGLFGSLRRFILIDRRELISIFHPNITYLHH